MNPHWEPAARHLPSPRAGAIEEFHASIPGFRPTRLIEVPSLAGALSAERVFVKFEQERLGLPSFKVVGASWAINCALADRVGGGVPTTFTDTISLAGTLPPGTTVTTATDGNHGRAVANIARRLSLRCRIFVPTGMATARIEAIRSEGAEVQIVNGTYDDAVRHSAAEADRHAEHVLVSDTSWPEYETIPAAVVEGYGTIFREAYGQLAEAGRAAGFEPRFDVAFVPAGVGAFASAAVTHLHSRGCAVITVEPTDADCVRQSLAAGTPIAVPGPHRSIMAGLNCGEVSRIAWPVLRDGVRAGVSVTDADVADAIRVLAAAGIPSGESGAAALAGATTWASAGVGSVPRAGSGIVLLLDTEGVTDPDAYATILKAS